MGFGAPDADGRVVDEMRDPTADSVLDRMKQFDPAAMSPLAK